MQPRLQLLAVWAASLAGLAAAEAQAAIIFNVESLTFFSDGVNPTVGTVDVFLTADPADEAVELSVGGFVAHLAPGNFSGSISGVTFLAPGEPVHLPDLFPADPVTSIGVGPGATAGGTDSSVAVALDSGAAVMSVNFQIAAGQSGTFDLSFVTLGNPFQVTQLYRFNDTIISTGVLPGTITISAVPEPSTIGLGAIGLLGFIGARWRRRKGPAVA